MTDELETGRTVVIVGQGGIQTDLDLDSLGDAEVADAIPYLLTDYSAECKDWTLIAGEHWRQKRFDRAEELLNKGLQFFAGGQGRHADPVALVNLHVMLAHLHLALARTAPKLALPHAKYDKISTDVKLKEYHFTEAAANLNRADQALQASGASADEEPASVAMGKIILYLARGQPNVAHPLVERLVARQPNNLVALLAQARLQFARRAHETALATYQKLLNLAPNMSPDPRIGLGLCFWVLGDKVRAKMAWERVLKRDETSWVALLLLGLSALNTAREPSVPAADRVKAAAEGLACVQRAFKLNNKSSASALALASISGQGGQIPVACKLAERAIQYADNKRHSVQANAERGRLGFMGGDMADAGPFIAAAKAEDPAGVNLLAELTLGQIAISNGNLREALNFIEQTAKRLNGKGPLEYTVLHASLLAYPHPGMSPEEIARNRSTARTMLSELQTLVENASTEEDWTRLRGVSTDSDIFLDLAQLWQDESLAKTIAAYQSAVSGAIDAKAEAASGGGGGGSGDDEEEDGPTKARNVKMNGNLGALFALQGSVDTAERMYHEALGKLGKMEGKDAEGLRTVLAYNLGRAYEEGGEAVKAAQWFRDVLRQHPEHVESKVRLAALAAEAGRNVDAHNLLKECLRSDETNLGLRSTYTHFLISIGSYREAFVFTSQTLKYDKNDAWTYCALGWLHFTLGREAKSTAEVAERPKQYLRSAEAYERALVIDPRSAVAAQGLAIALAEDTLSLKPLGSAAAAAGAGGPEEQKLRARMAGQALGVFSRISDSLPDGSVQVNIGHCYFIRNEEDKAIQAYEAASNSFKGRNVSVLLYLARAWYAYANRESNFSAMSKALSYCQKPSDRAILYNIAMIQQKAAEMLLALEPAKRTLDELQMALLQAQQAANMFRALADDTTTPLPYDKDLADQRARYGDGLLRKAPDQISRQQEFEGQAAARVEEARKARAEEQARIQAAETARRAELEAKAAELAEIRRKAREEALAVQEQLNASLAEEEAKKAAKSEARKRKKEAGGDDGDLAEGEEKPRKRRGTGGKKSRKSRVKSEEARSSDGEEEASMRGGSESAAEMSGSEGERQEKLSPEELARQQADRKRMQLEQLRNKRKSKQSKPEPEEEESGRKGKQFKSKAIIEDSDEEAGEDDAPEQVGPAGADEGNEAGDGGDAQDDDDAAAVTPAEPEDHEMRSPSP